MCESVGGIVKILVKLAVLALRVIYVFLKLCLRPRKKITFLSRQSDFESVDFVLLREALEKQNFDGEIETLCKKIGSSPFEKIGYLFHIFVQMYHIATSKVVVVDGYCIAVCVLNHRQNQKFVQIWHALNIVKKFGFQALDKPWGHSRATAESLCMHRNYTHIIACSEASGRVLSECFNTPMEKVILLPLPRIDYILGEPEKWDEISAQYPQIFEKPILLYAPTFRGEKVDLSWIEKAVDFEKYNVVVKLHPSDKQGIDSSVDKRVIVDSEFSSFEWMKVCKKLVTDYSGMGFEAMLVGKQVYYYLYDYEEYKSKNGLNLDLFSEEIKDYVVEKPQELKAVLEKEYDFSKTQSYLDKYLSVGTADCADRLARFLLTLL